MLVSIVGKRVGATPREFESRILRHVDRQEHIGRAPPRLSRHRDLSQFWPRWGPALPGQQDPARLRPVLVAAGLVAEGEDRCLDAVLQAEFGEDAADVGLDGLLADRQVPGDLPVAVAAGDQLEYFAFAR